MEPAIASSRVLVLTAGNPAMSSPIDALPFWSQPPVTPDLLIMPKTVTLSDWYTSTVPYFAGRFQLRLILALRSEVPVSSDLLVVFLAKTSNLDETITAIGLTTLYQLLFHGSSPFGSDRYRPIFGETNVILLR